MKSLLHIMAATCLATVLMIGCHRAEDQGHGNGAQQAPVPESNSKAGKPAGQTLVQVQVIATITFQVDDPVLKAEGPSPYMHLADPQKSLKWMRNPNEVVCKETELTVILDYPLRDAFPFPIHAASLGGFTRAELAQKIASLYKQVYEEEEKTSKIPVTPMDQRKGLINRNKTDGKYGIWGHDLDDLDLSTIELSRSADGKIQATLDVDS